MCAGKTAILARTPDEPTGLEEKKRPTAREPWPGTHRAQRDPAFPWFHSVRQWLRRSSSRKSVNELRIPDRQFFRREDFESLVQLEPVEQASKIVVADLIAGGMDSGAMALETFAELTLAKTIVIADVVLYQ